MVAIEGNTGEHYIGLHMNGNKCGISIQRGGSTQDYRHSANDMNDGKWHHLVLTRSSTTFSDFKAYLDGEVMGESATGNLGAGTGITFNKISMGYNDRKTSSYYNGQLDQVRIFNKALSAAEVTTLYNENSLIASYRFEGNAEDDTRNYDGTASNVTYEYGLSFTPDFVWTKERSTSFAHGIYDSTRGVNKYISPNTTDAEQDVSGATGGGLTSFDTGGFTLGSWAGENVDGTDYVAWCLKANGGTTSSNTDGSITSTVQVNETAGFSIIKFTGTGATATVGHGLSQTPEIYIMKNLEYSGYKWPTHTQDIGSLSGNRTGALNETSTFNVYTSASANSSTIGLVSGQPDRNPSGQEMIVYAFHSVENFSKFGSYTGNGSTYGPIIETGFEPALVIGKRTDSANNWWMLDNKRNTSNPRNTGLFPNLSSAELSGGYSINFLSNGFELATADGALNASGGTYIYMAFAADPDTVVPTKAKSFSTVTYTGNGTSLDLDTGFKPGLIWTKPRSYADNNQLWDIVRGAGWTIYSNATNAENPTIRLDGVSSFNNN